MKFLFSLTILLTTAVWAVGQSVVDTAGVTIIFTRGYTGEPFYRSALTGRVVYGGSMSKAASYIASYREYIPEGKFALVNFEERPTGGYALLPEDINSMIRSYMRYDTDSVTTLAGRKFGFVELGMNTRANRRTIEAFRAAVRPDVVAGFAPAEYRGMENDDSTVIVNPARGELGVLNVSPGGEVSFKKVDLSLFPGDRRYDDHFAEAAARARFFFTEPLTEMPIALDTVLHTFQKGISGAEISIVAPFENRVRSVEPGEATFADIYSMFPADKGLYLVVAELTGAEIKQLVKNLLAGRYYPDGTEKMWRDREGTLRYQNSVRLHSVSAPEYIDGRKRYTVAFNSDMFHSSPNAIAPLCGLTESQLQERVISRTEDDYRLLLRDFLLDHDQINDQ